MRRAKGPTRGNGAPIPETISLIRSFNVETNPSRPVRPSPLTASTIPDMPLDLLDRIRSFPLFKTAPDEFLTAIGRHLRPQVNASHDVILTEGDDARAIYWLVRGAVAVTSRDGEATYAELRPGAFFGEIGILMDMPRTATIVARTKCLLVVLKKEDFRTELPRFPDMETAIMEEAHERLTILNRKRRENGRAPKIASANLRVRGAKRQHSVQGEVITGDVGCFENGVAIDHITKKRKSPSPALTIEDPIGGSALGSGSVNVRATLKRLPLFSELPPDILHYLGLSAQPRTYPPFTDIIEQGTPGNEIYFIISGEVEIVRLDTDGREKRSRTRSAMRPRLKQGQYFGEVASLALAPKRTATVRSITTVECLMIGKEVLEELWRRCPPDIRDQVEATAKMRIQKTQDEDVPMPDVTGTDPAINALELAERPVTPASLPRVTFTPSKPLSPHGVKGTEGQDVIESIDPDPFLSVNMEDMKSRIGRRSSWAPPPTLSPPSSSDSDSDSSTSTGRRPSSKSAEYSKTTHVTTPSEVEKRLKRPRTTSRQRPQSSSEGVFEDTILVRIFSHLDIYHLIRLRQVSVHWQRILSLSPDLCRSLELSNYNRFITDKTLRDIICPFAGNRPRHIDLSNCFHVTDEGFKRLTEQCSQHVHSWRMKSVWDITANAILELTNATKDLEEIDLSNCRKVSDNLLARIIGWVVPVPNPRNLKSNGDQGGPPPGTVVGCPKLARLVLSYCKHVTDRSMGHLAVHAHDRLESMDLTRCTTITDAGFQHWSLYRFPRLHKLVLADCTYLTDHAISYLANAAQGLRYLDLSFCCALSDTATEVISIHFPHLQILKLAFCGSAVSDSSLHAIGRHLLELRELSVRGCVRVTGAGVEAVVEGCTRLVEFDVSQCKHLISWIEAGGEQMCRRRWRSQVRFVFEKEAGGGYR